MTAIAESPARFGFSVVAAAFGAQAVAIGMSLAAYPVLMESLEREFQISRTVTSIGIPALLIVGALVAPWVGRSIDRGSPRRVMASGALLMALGLAMISHAPSVVWAAVAWIGLVGVGQTMLGPLPAMTVLANWFVARRGTMIAVAAMGTTIGAAITPPLVEWLVTDFGWRAALVCLAAAAALIGVPVVWLGIVKRPEDVGLHPDGSSHALAASEVAAPDVDVASLLRDGRFWLVASSFGIMGGLGITLVTHVIPYAMQRGISRETAVALLTINALASAAGKLTFGVLADRLGSRGAGWTAVGTQAVGWTGMLVFTDTAAFASSVALISFGLGCMVPCQAGFVADLYGRENFGRVAGMIGLFSILGMAVLPPLIGAAYESLGSYELPLRFALVAVLVPALLLSGVAVPRTAPVVSSA